jgi:hypothetical protein
MYRQSWINPLFFRGEWFGFLDEQDGDVVDDREPKLARLAEQGILFGTVFQIPHAFRTGQEIEQFFFQHSASVLIQSRILDQSIIFFNY